VLDHLVLASQQTQTVGTRLQRKFQCDLLECGLLQATIPSVYRPTSHQTTVLCVQRCILGVVRTGADGRVPLLLEPAVPVPGASCADGGLGEQHGADVQRVVPALLLHLPVQLHRILPLCKDEVRAWLVVPLLSLL